jgi:endo-1,3(4)-beta-glucanase
MKTKNFVTAFLFASSALLFAVCGSLYAQWNYGTPFSTSAPSPSWHQVVNRPPLNEMFDSLAFPYPTNAWFNNLFLGQQPYPHPFGILGANKIHPYPYQLSLGSGYDSYPNFKALMAINYRPFSITTNTAPSGVPVINWNNANFCYMGTTEPEKIKPTILNDYTEISATVKFTDSTNSNRYYAFPIVRGMPYITAIYNNIKPGVYFPSPIISKVNDAIVTSGQTFTGTVFKIETVGIPNDPNRPQTWILFSSSSITLEYSIASATQGLKANSDFTGWLRLAHVTYQGENVTPQQVTDKINLLTAYAKFIPVKGEVLVSAGSGSSTASMQYSFTRYNEGSFGSDSLLMMALPHHVDMLSNSTTNVLRYAVLKGDMKEVRQKTWNMTESLPDYTWYPKDGTLATVPLQWCDTLQHYVNKDYQAWFNRNWLPPDVYFGEKAFSRLARVILVADELYERDNSRYASMQTLAQTMRDTLKIYLGTFLDGRHTLNPIHGPGAWDSLFYDSKFGGLISALSWDSLNITNGIAYGSALYNDHHFHYGYSIYAAAVVARKNPTWFTNNSNHYLNRVTDLIRDIANTSKADGHFGLMRYHDMFEGHSWANGMIPFGDGKNQESSSEAYNAWYGIYLFGHAMSNENIKTAGQFLLAQEVRSTKKYYQISLPQSNPVYPAFFTDKMRVVTNMYQTALDGQTFFGTEPYSVYGIHIIPLTPVTEQVWTHAYAKDVFDYTAYGLRHSQAFDSTNTNIVAWQWAGICTGSQAVAYPQEALNFFKFYGYNNANYDNGNTATNTMYWILTRVHHPGVGITNNSGVVPDKYELHQNYPNPFNPNTFINFSIPKKSFVKITVYDMLGKEISKLVQSEMDAGSYKYEFNASRLSSGVYFYTLEAGSFIESKKMMLIK